MTSSGDSESSPEQLRQAKIVALLARYGAASPNLPSKRRSRPRHYSPPP